MVAKIIGRSAFLSALLTAAFLSSAVSSDGAQSKPSSMAELALYRGADREKILLEGAKKEGELTFYTSNTWVAGPVSQAFEKKYPFIKANVWRSDSKSLLKRLIEELTAGRSIADVVETSPEYMAIMLQEKMLQEYFSPELSAYDDEAKIKGTRGVYAWTNREIYISLGFNTKLVSPGEAPKTLNDYLDPKWKGKMSIAGTTTGVRWVGAVMEAMGREFLEKASAQDINVQNISGAALSGLVASGEVPLSPTIFNSNVFTHKQKGAPVEWRPVDPVIAGVGTSGMVLNAPHPHAALLFLDYLHSKEGQEVAMKGGLSSARNDIGSLEQKFKKLYLESKYTPEEFEKKIEEWEALMRRLFIRKR
ncbi:MAG TPA: extracellular solute-binding protein [Candidatus Binatia bacterium]|nr:extracellular solute-binding protein [Candidatus Binatia bacterium]